MRGGLSREEGAFDQSAPSGCDEIRTHRAEAVRGSRRGRGNHSVERLYRAGARHGAFGRDFRRGADGLDASGERAGGFGGSIRRFRAAGGE